MGGELVEGYDLDFSRMDPINGSWYDPGFFALYEALITNNPDGGLEPQLAESWEFSEDGLAGDVHTSPRRRVPLGPPRHRGQP